MTNPFKATRALSCLLIDPNRIGHSAKPSCRLGQKRSSIAGSVLSVVVVMFAVLVAWPAHSSESARRVNSSLPGGVVDSSSGLATFGWRALVPDASRVGQGQFRRFGFLIYNASLWAPAGQFNPRAPYALELTYARNIARDQIVDASLDQMGRLGYDLTDHPGWREQLQAALTDVREGDVLTGVYEPGRGASIFFGGRRLGTLDESLAQAFFAIWLDHRTSDPELRAELLGQAQ